MSKAYSAAECAFLIGYADYCIYYNLDYPTSVASKFQQIFPRSVIWANLKKKVKGLIMRYSVRSPSLPNFVRLGTGYLDMSAIPSDVRTELERIHREWDIPILGAEVNPKDSVSQSNDIQGSRLEEHNTLQSDTTAEDSQEQCYSETITDDGAADRTTTPSLSPAPTSNVDSSNRTAKEKSAASPIETDELGHKPTSKSKKTPSDRPPASVTNRDVAGPKPHGPAKTPRTSTSDDRSVNKKKIITTLTLQAPSSASGKMRAAPVTNIDDWPEDSQAVASSSRIADVKKATEASKDNTVPLNDHDTELSSRSAGKRKLVQLSDDEVLDVNIPLKKQKTVPVSLESLNQKVDACFDMISSMITYRQSPPEEYSEHIYQLIRTFKDPRGSAVENLIKDLDSQRSLKTKHRNMIQKLVGFVDLSNGTAFPRTPDQKEVNKTWETFYKHIVSTIGPNTITPNPTPEGAGYITCASEGIANGRIPDDQLADCIDSLRRYLVSPHAQQTLVSALFCRWVFGSPEPMFKAMHSDGMLHLYTGIVSAAQDPNGEGLAKVQQYDKVATKLMFEDPDFQRAQVLRRTSEFNSRFEAVKKKICQPSNIPSSLSPSRFAKKAISLKKKLLLSPKEYRIHFIRPGYKFQASRMQAYDQTNEPVSDAKAEGKPVLMCMFPMLTCEEPHTIEEDAKIEDVLCKNKNFFPTFKESMQVPIPNLQLSKAAVLVSQD